MPKKTPPKSPSTVKWSLKRIGDTWCAKVEVVPRLGTTNTVLGDGTDVAIGVSAVASDANKAEAMLKASGVLLAMTGDPQMRESLPAKSKAALEVVNATADAASKGKLESFAGAYGAATTAADKVALKAVKSYVAAYGVPPQAVDVVHNARKKTEKAFAGSVKKLAGALRKLF